MTKPIQIAATIEGLSTLKDGSVSIRIHSQELTAESKVELMGYVGQYGWMLFAPNKLNDEDVPLENAPDEDQSPSKRLRAVIMVYAKQKGIRADQYNDFYRVQVEHLIEQFKGRLE